MLEKLLSGVSEARKKLPASDFVPKRPKLLLKISPDLTSEQIKDVAQVVRSSHVDGVIVSNTTIQRPKGLRDRAFALPHTCLPNLNLRSQT